MVQDKKLQQVFFELTDHVNQLNKACFDFKDSVFDVVASHKRIRRTLQCHLHVLELLELPQLVESCARNGALDEALELASFVKSLEKRHSLSSSGSKSSVVRGIVNDVCKSLLYMRRHMMQQLSLNASITKQVNTVATLRKLDGILLDGQEHGFAEMRRMMEYLEARTIWMHNADSYNPSASSFSSGPVKEVSNTDIGAYTKAVELLETRRTSLYTIVNQFRALFSDSDPSVSEEILRKWTTHQVLTVLKNLEGYLENICDGSGVKALLEQAIFFSKRLSDEGADFTSSVLQLFSYSVESHFARGLMSAHSRLCSILDEEQQTSLDVITVPLYVGGASISVRSSHQPSLKGIAELSSVVTDLPPPSQLLAFPPLCYYLNSIIGVFTYLRSCPLQTVAGNIKQALIDESLRIVNLLTERAVFLRSAGSTVVSDISRARQQNSQSLRLDKMYAEAVAFDLLPHMFLLYLLVFREVDPTTVRQIYEMNVEQHQNFEASHLFSPATNLDGIFPVESMLKSTLFSCWQKLAEYKLVQIE